jgi:hypothetical protein
MKILYHYSSATAAASLVALFNDALHSTAAGFAFNSGWLALDDCMAVWLLT